MENAALVSAVLQVFNWLMTRSKGSSKVAQKQVLFAKNFHSCLQVTTFHLNQQPTS